MLSFLFSNVLSDVQTIHVVNPEPVKAIRVEPVKVIAPKVIKTKAEIISYIKKVSAEVGYKNPEIAIHIVKEESQFRVKALGDHGMSRGLVQIHKRWHPEVSDKQAYNPEFAIRFLVTALKKGKCGQWSTCPI